MCKKPQSASVDVVCFFCGRKAKAAPNANGKLEVISENGWQFFPLTNDWAHTSCQSQVKAPYHRLNMYTAIQAQHTRQLDKIDSERKHVATITLEANAPADIVSRVDALRIRQSRPPKSAPTRKSKAAPVIAAPKIEAAPVVTPARKPKAIRKSAPVVSVAALSPTDRENVQRENVLRVAKPKAPPVQKSALVPPPLHKRKSHNVSQACAEYFGDVAKRVTSLLVRLAIASVRNRIEAAIGNLRKRVENLDKKLDG